MSGMFVTLDDDGETRIVWATTPQNKIVGWLERGRAMTDLRSSWTEWRFLPALLGHPNGPVRRTYSAAYEDARQHIKQAWTAQATPQPKEHFHA